jgi:hypothetical protein
VVAAFFAAEARKLLALGRQHQYLCSTASTMGKELTKQHTM